MKVLIPVKHVIDSNIRIRVKPDQSGVETTNVKMSMNPFDEVAIEEALRLRDTGMADELVVVSIGVAQCRDTIRSGLAMGADRGMLVETDVEIEPLTAAKILKAIVEHENPGLVLLGKQAIDDDSNQTGQMLAALLNWPQATFASNLELTDGHAEVTRQTDGGSETINIAMPAVITVDLSLNEPRYASLPHIIKAREKLIFTTTPEDLGVEVMSRLTILKIEESPPRQAGTKVASVAELVDKLRDEVRVT